ncbi:MAG: Asp-tRNA(Asn)/Glu-tRNA(Gln) amidotransferase GatCAB subunit B, partial [Candidatus Paceibacterota bacterium]
VADNQNVFEEYKTGKDKALQYLIGQAMKESKGSANPGLLKKLFEAKVK